MSLTYKEARHRSIHGDGIDEDKLSRFIGYAEKEIEDVSKTGKFYTYSYWDESKKFNEELAQHFTSKGFKTKVKFDPLINEYRVRIGWYENWVERWFPIFVNKKDLEQ